MNTQENTFKNNFDKVINELNNLDKKYYCLKLYKRRDFKNTDSLLRKQLLPAQLLPLRLISLSVFHQVERHLKLTLD